MYKEDRGAIGCEAGVIATCTDIEEWVGLKVEMAGCESFKVLETWLCD